MSLLIPHGAPLTEGRLVHRFDRFIADVKLHDQSVVRAHCVNTGRMEGLVRPGARVWISPAPRGRKRKLQWTLELMETDSRIVGANTLIPNTLAETLVRRRMLTGLKRWRSLEREVPYGAHSRIDLMLRGSRDHLVEVKNCHLVYPDFRGYFPDSVSTRATGHLVELQKQVEQGLKATVLFVVQREDARCLRPSKLHDPDFYYEARRAASVGVRFRAVRIRPASDGYHFEGMMPVDLGDYDASKLEPWRAARAEFSGWRRRGKA